ncbi:uncharacterized protein LOC144944694 [Lampetra fluviatilis]
MAESQIACLEDNFGWRPGETHKETSHSEEQRLALEALLRGGTPEYLGYTNTAKVKPFLSDKELALLLHEGDHTRSKQRGGHGTSSVGSSEQRPSKSAFGSPTDGGAAGLSNTGSLTYWPDRSDAPAPDLELGWPAVGRYRGVTRVVAVHAQPPLGPNAPSIKEAARAMVQGAHQVIAVVMDEFSDVDILKDVADAAVRRRVPVYVLVDEQNVASFLAACRAVSINIFSMRNMRARSLEGLSFCSRNGARITGRMQERFMIIDGDQVLTGTYSFTWWASRMDRHIVTALSGQVVETFDMEFRFLYAQSKPLQEKQQQQPGAPAVARPPLQLPIFSFSPSPAARAQAATAQPQEPPLQATSKAGLQALPKLFTPPVNPLYALVKQGHRSPATPLEPPPPTSPVARSEGGGGPGGGGGGSPDSRPLRNSQLLAQQPSRSVQGTDAAKSREQDVQPPLSPANAVAPEGADREICKAALRKVNLPDHVARHKVDSCLLFEGDKERGEAAPARSAIEESAFALKRRATLSYGPLAAPEDGLFKSRSTYDLSTVAGEHFDEEEDDDDDEEPPHAEQEEGGGKAKKDEVEVEKEKEGTAPPSSAAGDDDEQRQTEEQPGSKRRLSILKMMKSIFRRSVSKDVPQRRTSTFYLQPMTAPENAS